MNLDIYVSSYSSIISIYRCVPVCVRGLHRWIVQTLEWCRGDKSTGCPSGYREIILSSVKLKSTTQGRDSGGIIIGTNSELSIELVKSEQYHVAENKKRHYINISARLSVCHIYIPPLESPYFQDETFPNIEQEISHFQTQGNVLFMGDFNSRTGDKLDFIASQGSRFITGNNRLFPPPRQ